jgi:fatty-acyl-CoA synthase
VTRSFVRLLADSAAAHGHRVAVVDPALDRTVTYAGLAGLVDAAAATLLSHGLAADDRVAVLARNGLEQAVAVLACSRAGLVHVGLAADAPVARLRVVLEQARPRMLLVQDALVDRAHEAIAGLDRPPVVRSTDVLLDTACGSPARDVPDDPDRTYALICTSGSTGRPKLVHLTGAMTDTAARTYTGLLGLGPADRTAVHLPMWWVSGHVTQLASALHSGGSIVTMPDYSPSALLRVVAEHDVTWLDLVPTLWHGLLREDGFAADRLPTLRAAVFGGAPASPHVLARVRDRLPSLALHDVYAMSEVPAPMTARSETATGTDAPAGSVGRALPHADVAVVDPDGRPLPSGRVGAVAVRSPARTPGYASDDVLALDEQGRFRTGDLGALDEAGCLTITGRVADVVIRGGVNIHPVEVEEALLGSGLVQQALVVGVPSRLHGEDVAALVVPDGAGCTVDVAALRAAVAACIGSHAAPSRVVVVADLPRTGNGKPDRAAARRILGQQR